MVKVIDTQLNQHNKPFSIYQTEGGNTYVHAVDVITKNQTRGTQWRHLPHAHADFIVDTDWKTRAGLVQALAKCGIEDVNDEDDIMIEDGEMNTIHAFKQLTHTS